MKSHLAFAALAAAVTLSSAAQAGPTLEAVKKSGTLNCGVSTGLIGFSQPDSQGRYTGLDVDVCRMVAAAVLGDANKSSSCRSARSSASPPSNPARSRSCRGRRHGHSSATPSSGSISPGRVL